LPSGQVSITPHGRPTSGAGIGITSHGPVAVPLVPPVPVIPPTPDDPQVPGPGHGMHIRCPVPSQVHSMQLPAAPLPHLNPGSHIAPAAHVAPPVDPPAPVPPPVVAPAPVAAPAPPPSGLSAHGMQV